ncbi:MAG: T9SS type A sorting domain-containing protein [Ignavibacteriaceae bacterium]|nr:T9SS type A sorting domain-containing protein [Ignavibacteriaceae bacterium]
MPRFFLAIVISLLIITSLPAQVEFLDKQMENTIFSNAPDNVKNTKAFSRQWAFWEERAYPEGFISPDAYSNSIKQKMSLRELNFNKEAYNSVWVSLGPTPGAYFNYGNISSRIVTGSYHPTDPNIIYIGAANGGVWKSTDGGVSWSPLTDYQASLSMGAIVIDPYNPNVIYAGTGEATYSGASYYGRGLLKSTDAGNTWSHITNGLPLSTYFSRIVIRPNFPDQLLAALGSAGLFRSTDAGLSWTVLASGRCDDVVFTPNGDTAFAVGSGIGIVRSIDGGATFQSFGSSGLSSGSRTHFDLCRSNTNYMYAAVYFNSGSVNIFKSTNKGLNWTTVLSNLDGGGQAWYDLYCRVNPLNPEKVYVGAIDIFRSTNAGSTFTNITNGYNGGSVHVDQHFLFFHPTDENTFFVCNDGGVWKTTNNGNSFTNMNQTLTLTQFYRIAASPYDPSRILGGTQDNGTQQTLSTLNWAAVYGGDGGEVSFSPFSSAFILGETQNGGIFRTTNNGVNWYSSTSGINNNENAAWVAPIIAHPGENGVFFVARQRIYKSTNNGASWTAISGNVNGTSSVRELAISKSNPQILYATSGSKVFLSTDGGVNWTNKTAGLPNKTITSVYVHPDSSDIVMLTFSGFGTNKVYKSTNGGNSWQSIHGNLPDSPVNDLFIYTEDAANPQTYFVGTDIGVFYTQNNGLNWIELYNGLPNTVILHIDYSPSTKMLRAGTHGRGVYETYIDFGVPVELSTFYATIDDKKIILDWSTDSETNNNYFEVQRKFKNSDWTTIGVRQGNGTTTEKKSYRFVDDYSDNYYSGTVLYRLKQTDFNGSFDYSNVIDVNVEFAPIRIELGQNFPNPFNPTTTIKYTIPFEANVKLEIFNSLGQHVQTLVDKIQNPGFYESQWTASSKASGIYFYSLVVSDLNNQNVFKDMKKLILMK